MTESEASWRDRLGGWLRLCRLPNLFTVPGDPVFGFLAGGGALTDRRLPWLVGAVLLCYLFGLLDNDLHDLAEDRRERPERPLPSGRVGVGAARAARLACAAGGLAAAAMAGRLTLILALLLLVLAAAYNRFKCYPPLGPALVALCRLFAVMLGFAGTDFAVTNPLLMSAVPMVWFFYVYGVGMVAAGETRPGPVRGRWIILLVPLGWLGLVLGSTALEYRLGGLAPGLLFAYVVAALALWLGIRNWLALGGIASPATVQRAVGELITGLIFLQASGCAVAGAPHSDMHVAAVGLLLLWLPARRLGRWIPGS